MKESFQNVEFREAVKLGAINSINWARVLAQITYYFYSYLRITDSQDSSHREPINYVVPTGNFGDILAGYFAQQMGLPIDKLVVATNQNDVLHRFFATGQYTRHPAIFTIAPSMDISISSNFERYLFYLADQRSDTLNEWMSTFETTGTLSLGPELLARARQTFSSSASDETRIVAAMQRIEAQDGYLVCPHTATAVNAVQDLQLPAARTVVLATAHPAKFEAAMALALGPDKMPPRPEALQALFSLPTRVTELQKNSEFVQDFILAHVLTPPSAASRICSTANTNSSVDDSNNGKSGCCSSGLGNVQVALTVGVTVLAAYLLFRYLKRSS